MFSLSWTAYNYKLHANNEKYEKSTCSEDMRAEFVRPFKSHRIFYIKREDYLKKRTRNFIGRKNRRSYSKSLKCGVLPPLPKCTLVQALRLCTGRTAHCGSRGIALLFLDHGTRRGWRVSVTVRLLFTPGKDPVPIVQEAGWVPGPVWTGAENLAPTRIRSPDRPARNQSLYRLRYPAHTLA